LLSESLKDDSFRKANKKTWFLTWETKIT